MGVRSVLSFSGSEARAADGGEGWRGGPGRVVAA
jgi:hypothetical protein